MWVGRYYFLTCCRVISNLVLISIFFEGVALTSDQKELFFTTVITLFYIFFIFRMMYLGMKFGMKSDGDTLKLILHGVSILIAMAIFYRLGGLNVETYDSILQALNQSNFDYLIDHYGRYFCFACLYLVSYKLYYRRLFVNAIDINSFKDNHLSWNVSDWLACFVSPNYIRLEKEGRVKVQFCLDYSWIRINHSHALQTIEQC